MRPEYLNRVDKDLMSMNSEHNKNKLLYPTHTGRDRADLKDRLKHMIEVKNKYKNEPLTRDERKSYNKLKRETNKLEDQLYPTFLEKILARIGRVIDKVRDNLRYGKQSNTAGVSTEQDQRSLTNRQKFRNAITEKLNGVKEKLLPNTQRERKNEQVQSNHFSVNRDTFKQKVGSLTIDNIEKPKHRLKIK